MSEGAKTITPMRVLDSDTGSRVRGILYWLTTAIIALESAVGGVWDVLRTDYVRDVLERQLGYPWYVAVILGVWKIPGALILVARRFPRLKEWVYAGAIFVYTGAAASHFFVGNVGTGIGPLGFAAITMISWALRPASRRHPAPYSAADLFPGVPRRNTATTIAFWVVSLSFTGALLSGGVADLIHRPETVGGMVALGYPGYFLYVIGFWKVLAPAAILLPGFTRLKEWAYAGAFFNFSGAVTSHLVSGSAWYHVAYTSLFALCTLASWALRPGNRVLGRRLS
ncbi:DoxX family protein [Nonomuraea roseoviolacea]|uniref:Membrane protein YphA (DoxX/SURF4 family) n=1 Tax=Nonomuraea roseoviolacea subsp. carminata TaxID=160689 RepID=A0ABT1K1K7_9ACTN|nr:DoxX family protein [Nonomuraea roseoviolacea]MCP2347876.1 putative membrane protein YphA (DoxX/SURF4 family) [Nonomuraea roseoviolacea subsp. carminata]